MRIFCVDIYNRDIPDFYIKPETSQIRSNESLYIPIFCQELRYEFAFAIKVNRVTKSINEDFSSRCWSELGIVINFWSEDLAIKQVENGGSLDVSHSFDRSFALPNDFVPLSSMDSEKDILLYANINNKEVAVVSWSEINRDINKVISHISSYITLKIGDVIMIKNSNRESYIAKIGDKIELRLNNNLLIETQIK